MLLTAQGVGQATLSASDGSFSSGSPAIVLELSGSVAAVGLTVALQFAPMLFLGLYGGVLVDRYSKRMKSSASESSP